MYLGQMSVSFSPVNDITIKPSIPSRTGVSSEILSWRKENSDFPWIEFVEWFKGKYLPSWKVRMPLPAPENYYKELSTFLSDVIEFERQLYGEVISDVGTADDEYPLYTPPELPPGYAPDGSGYDPSYHIPPPPTVPEASGFPWTYVAIGGGALVVVLLAMKKKG